MAGRAIAMIGLTTVVVIAALCPQVTAQSGCAPVILSLMPCLGFITGNSSAPSASCCSQLASVVQTQGQCLCAMINSGGAGSLGLNINQTQALTLPGACNVQTPPLSQCNAAAGGPAPAPAMSPSAPLVPSNTLPATPSTPSVPKGSSPSAQPTPSVPKGSSPSAPATPSVPSVGSKSGPLVTNDGGSKKFSNSMAFAILFLAACVSSFTTL